MTEVAVTPGEGPTLLGPLEAAVTGAAPELPELGVELDREEQAASTAPNIHSVAAKATGALLLRDLDARSDRTGRTASWIVAAIVGGFISVPQPSRETI